MLLQNVCCVIPAELQERMKYLDITLGADSGNEYYENICIKAVNQCLGVPCVILMITPVFCS